VGPVGMGRSILSIATSTIGIASPSTERAIGSSTGRLRKGKFTYASASAPGDQQRVKGGAPGDRQRAKVKVLNRKGIANQTGPESCVAHREVRDEALTGEPAGQPLSRESFKSVQGADAVSVAEGNTDRYDNTSAYSALRGLRTWHVGTLFVREPGDFLLGRFSCCRAVRVGKMRNRSR